MKKLRLPSAILTAAWFLVVITTCITPLNSQTDIASPDASAAATLHPCAGGMTPQQLETRGDGLRSSKLFLQALDCYQKAVSKEPSNYNVYNKAGIVQLLLEHYREAEKDFQRAIHINHQFANARNNLGVVYYERKNYGKAIHQYRSAIKLDPKVPSYYVNLGAACFSKKKWKDAADAYSAAIQLDPTVFVESSSAGTSVQMSSPRDRAHFEYLLAQIYAKHGMLDRALVSLRRAMEDGYPDINDVYSNRNFASVREDPRFKKLMANRPYPISE